MRKIAWSVGNAVRHTVLTLCESGRDRFDRRSESSVPVHPADVMLNFSDSMLVNGYARRVADLKRRYGLRFGALIHDIIPITHPHFVHQDGHDVAFGRWFSEIASVSDFMLVASHYNRRTIQRWAMQGRGLLTDAINVIPFGSGFSSQRADTNRPCRLPESFVLFVSTIEIRKNHQLLFDIWQRMIERHGARKVPSLVFVGRVGWKVEGLLRKLRASRNLEGKIQIVTGLSDAQVGDAYRRCLFTVFPSICEGWGLPVAESLVQGTFCLASTGGSLPEVGGDLITYFDPDDLDDACGKIERAIFDPAWLAEQTMRIRREYQPSTWDACADAVIEAVDRVSPRAPCCEE